MRSTAIIAAHQATDAAAALLLHDAEGHFGDVEVVGKLAEALALAVDIHLAEVEDCDHSYRDALDTLRRHAAKFIEGWVG